MWSLFFIVQPFYFFESGYPQVAHFLMLFISILVFLGYGFQSLDKKMLMLIKVFGLLLAYIIVVNLIWSLILKNMVVLNLNSIYYLFNFIVFTIFLLLYKKLQDRIILYTLYGIIVGVLFQTVISLSYMDLSGFRQTLLFNNPNQLGYYAVICASIFFVISCHLKIKTVYQYLFYLMIMYLAFLSLSKAALVSIAILMTVMLKKKLSIVLLLLVSLMIIYPIVNTYTPILTNVEKRIVNIGKTSDDNLVGRGYDRIINHPQYLLFGAGEGMHRRFQSKLSAELHSGPGTLLFAYGLIGLSLFMYLIYLILEPFRERYIYLIYLLPVIFYSLTHHNLRWSLFWIFVAIIAVLRQNEEILVSENSLILDVNKNVNKNVNK